MKVGHIPFINYRLPGDPEVATMVVELITESIKTSKPIRGVMLDRLGPVVWHQSPSTASAVLEELEETAKLWLMSNCQATPLSDVQIEDLRRTFGAIW
jgi:ribulose-5-phosphate 4-epimerase/fuculose-1-phosphate aldolase